MRYKTLFSCRRRRPNKVKRSQAHSYGFKHASKSMKKFNARNDALKPSHVSQEKGASSEWLLDCGENISTATTEIHEHKKLASMTATLS